MKYLYEYPIPKPSETIEFEAEMLKIKYKHPESAEVEFIEVDYYASKLFVMPFKSQDFCQVLFNILLEKNTIFVSDNSSQLSIMIEGFVALIKPFKWPFFKIPFVPHSYINLLSTAGMPFISSILVQNLLHYKQLEETILSFHCLVISYIGNKLSILNLNEVSNKAFYGIIESKLPSIQRSSNNSSKVKKESPSLYKSIYDYFKQDLIKNIESSREATKSSRKSASEQLSALKLLFISKGCLEDTSDNFVNLFTSTSMFIQTIKRYDATIK